MRMVFGDVAVLSRGLWLRGGRWLRDFVTGQLGINDDGGRPRFGEQLVWGGHDDAQRERVCRRFESQRSAEAGTAAPKVESELEGVPVLIGRLED